MQGLGLGLSLTECWAFGFDALGVWDYGVHEFELIGIFAL